MFIQILQKPQLIPIVVGSILALIMYLFGLSLMNTILFVLGTGIGIGLLLSDERYFAKTYQLSQPFSQTFLFMLVYAPLLVFVMTSSGSFIASGLVIAIGLMRLSVFVQLLASGSYQPDDPVPASILSGGKKPFTMKELEYIAIALGGTLVVLAIRMVFYL